MSEDDIYVRLAAHLQYLGMGYPQSEALLPILEKNYSPEEAAVALAIPTGVIPLQPATVDEIAQAAGRPADELVPILEGLANRGIVFSGEAADGSTGYALQQVAFGFPQAFYWSGEATDHSREMAREIPKFLDIETSKKIYASTETKAFRFIPLNRSLEISRTSVMPYHLMEHVIENAKTIAKAHCVCRARAQQTGGGCDHLMEVCLKFDEMAEYVIERGMAEDISKAEAHAIMQQCHDDGLIHFVDNAVSDIKHNCNCCGCCCWSIARMRRRLLPRDSFMACYFIRETDLDECRGCGREAAQWLLDNRDIDAVGIDTPSIDYGQSKQFETHQILYPAQMPGFATSLSRRRF